MNEMELIKIFSSFGGPGLVALILWLISKRYMDAHQSQVQVTQEMQSRRIDALEKASSECQEDRKRLHAELVELLKDRSK